MSTRRRNDRRIFALAPSLLTTPPQFISAGRGAWPAEIGSAFSLTPHRNGGGQKVQSAHVVAASRTLPLAGLEVLVVEDARDASDSYRGVLAYFGATVTTARSADSALRVLAYLRVDLVIVDLHLGTGDARSLLREARMRGVRAPFIAVMGDDFDPAAIQQAGFTAFLRKPVEHAALLDVVRAVAGR